MAGYSKEEMDKMQNDAIQRVRAMQQRAQNVSKGSPPMPDFVRPLSGQTGQTGRDRSPEQHARPQPEPSHRPQPEPNGRTEEPHQPPPKQGRGASLLQMLNLKGIDIDSDRSLILMMLALLSGEGGDELLMLALLYIML